MVKVKPGSRKGMTKLGTASKKSARRQATKQRNGLASSRAIIQESMRETWNKAKSPASNLSRIGLKARINTVKKAETNGSGEVQLVNPRDANCEKVLRKLEQEANAPEKPANRVVHPGEKLALQKMIAKYGSDWERMSRDIKLNYLQWTPKQLEKKALRMKEILGVE